MADEEMAAGMGSNVEGEITPRKLYFYFNSIKIMIHWCCPKFQRQHPILNI